MGQALSDYKATCHGCGGSGVKEHKWFCNECGRIVELKELCPECGKNEKTGTPIIMVSRNVFMWECKVSRIDSSITVEKSQMRNRISGWVKHQLWRIGLYPDRCFYCGTKLVEHGFEPHQYFTCPADGCRFNSL